MADNEIGLVAALELAGFRRSHKEYEGMIDRMNMMTLNAAKSLSSSFLGLGDSLLKIATILSVAVVAGAGLALAALVKLSTDAISKAADLEQGIANIASVLNVSKDEAGFLKDVIVDLGLDPTLRVTTFEAAEALELLAKNGIFAGLSISEMESTAREAGKATIFLANATGANFGQAANIATDAMVLFNLQAKDLTDVVSSITSVTTNSKFTIDDYELALRNGGAAVAQFGVSLEDFNVMVALSAEELGTGMKAGTGWLNFMNRITPNTEKATNAMKDLGLMTADGTNLFFDASGRLKDMSEVAGLLNQALYGTTKVVSAVSNRTAEQNKLLGELTDEYNDAQDTIWEYTSGAKSLLATEEEKNKALEGAYAIIDKITPTMDELNGVSSEYVTTLQSLTDEQRAVAIETIFGNDAMKSAIALAHEGAVASNDYEAVMRAYGVSANEAFTMIANGLTKYELLNQEMSKTDAQDAAITRMDTLRGKMEILSGVIEALKIKFGDPLVAFLSDVADKVLAWWEANDKLENQLGVIGRAVADFFRELMNGNGFMASFTELLQKVAGDDVAGKFTELVTSVQNFIAPIKEFVEDHAEEFKGALEGIGVVLATAMAASLIMGIATALWALVNPATILIGIGALIGAAFEGNWLGIRDKIYEVKDALDELGSSITGVKDFEFNGIDSLVSFGDAIRQIVEQGALLDTVGAMLGSIKIPNLGRNAMGSIDTLGEGFAKLIELAQPIIGFVTALGNTVKPVIDKVIEAFRNFNVVIMDWTSTTGESTQAINIWQQLKDTWAALQPIVTALIGLLAALWGSLVSFASGVIGGAIEPLLTGLGMAFAGILQMIEGLADMITGLFGIIVGIFTGDFDKIKTSAESFIAGFIGLVEGLFNTIIGIVAYGIAAVVQGIAGGVQSVIDFFQNLYMELVGASIIPDMVNAIIEWFLTLGSSVLSAVADLIAALISKFITLTVTILTRIALFVISMGLKFRELFTTLKEIVEEKVTEVIEKFQKFIADILKLFTDTDWKQLGQNIMDGIVDGITNKLAAAKATLLGVAQSLQDAWNDFWGSHSPSRLMIESGQDIMAGATIGVMNSAAELTKAMGFAGGNALRGFTESTANLLPNAPTQSSVSNSSNVTNNYSLQNSFAGNPQITDVSQLEMTLAGYR